MKPHAWGWDRWALVGFVLLGWALRLPPVLDNRLHADEALYAYWGLLIGRGRDPWLVGVPVYKPPLLAYLLASAQTLFGSSEFAARLPRLAAGIVTVVLVAALSQALYGDRRTAIGPAAAVALSPFAILFSATAFTDPVMVALGMGATTAMARGRPGRAGILAGLSFATKQTGLAWLPLAAAISLTRSPKLKFQIPKPKSPTSILHSLFSALHSPSPNPHPGTFPSSSATRPLSFFTYHLSFLLGFLLLVILVFGWDTVRVAQGAESFWVLGITGYGGLRVIWPQELWTRLRDWAGLARYLFVSPFVNGSLIVGLIALAWQATTKNRYTRTGLTDLFLAAFVAIYLLLHWLWAFPVWDRYLLPLVPVLAILLGRIYTLLASVLQTLATHISSKSLQPSPAIHTPSPNSRPSRPGLCHLSFDHFSFPHPSFAHFSFLICHLSFVIFLLFPAWTATHSRYPVGGDHGAYDGIDEVAAFLHERPEGTVVYQHWLGWHYADYLFDAPVYVAYWPTPAWLAQDVQAFGLRGLRYITFPSWESPARVERALAEVGYALAPELTTVRRDGTRSFTVYQIQPLSNL